VADHPGPNLSSISEACRGVRGSAWLRCCFGGFQTVFQGASDEWEAEMGSCHGTGLAAEWPPVRTSVC
jgi:hypothetical protein